MSTRRPRVEPLELFDAALGGQRLVEASAGTGKTYTIAGLFLRLVVESGHPVERILVVTYTNAATAELRERIRARLVELRELLRGGEGDDSMLTKLVETLPDRALALRRVEAAVLGFDTASVYTIHGFCQRALAEHAFASGVAFDRELVPDPSARLRQVVEDFWRRELHDAEPSLLRRLLATGETPGRWLEFARSWVGRPYVTVDAPLPGDAAALAAGVDAAFDKLRAVWDHEAVVASLSGGALNGRSYTAAIIGRACDAVSGWIAAGQPPLALCKDTAKLTPALLVKNTKKNAVTPGHPAFEVMADLAEALTAQEDDFTRQLGALRARLLAGAGAALEKLNRERREHSYDDLLLDLHRALQGEGGEQLAELLRERYPAALVDEFQDTDPVQYGILRGIYAGGEAPLYLVGDPKQAIYGFRGADVFAYLEAGAESHGAYALTHNWRSAPALIDAVNALFSRRADAFVVPGIAFSPALAADCERQPLRIEGDSLPPLRVWHATRDDDKPWSKEDANTLAATATATEIARLLTLAGRGAALIGERRLAGGDIAVLVPTHRQGEMVRRELRMLGVASVQLSGESVFASHEAGELERLLLALAEPAREPLVRAALITDLLGSDGVELERLSEDERLLEEWLERFDGWHREWRERGLLPAIRALFEDRHVASRLLALPDGERRLTNTLHLAELLQAGPVAEGLGMAGTLKWLATRRENAASSNRAEEEAQELRLESDQNLVNIVTVHRSKGLEYPLVFCPFLWDVREPRAAPQWAAWHDPDDHHRYRLDLASERFAEAQAAQTRERLAESLRLAYVALTRARHRCYLFIAQGKGFAQSAPGWLLDADAAPPAQVLAELAASHPDAITVDEPPGPGVPMTTDSGTGVTLAARRARGPVRSRRQTGSFSSLARGHAADRPDHDAGVAASSPGEPQTPPTGIFAFARGARAGTCLHAVFEALDFPLAASPEGREALERLVEARLRAHGFASEWREVVADMVVDVLGTPLADGGSPRLAEVTLSRCRHELEFYYPVAGLAAQALSRLLTRHDLPSLAGEPFATLVGHLKGFIDLVYEADGRWYVLDWKSNWLGAEVADYAAERLVPVMHREGYHLQYLLYTLALHRWLRLRLPGYDYQRHFGGVQYLFLRGMRPDNGPASGVFRTRPSLELIEALDALMSGEAA